MAIVAYIALADFLLHLYAGGRYGYSLEELYALICARHPAWGYGARPPLLAFIARLSVAWFGSSLRAIRVLPAAAAAVTVVLTGLLARELGGRRFAQALAALAILLAPGFLAAGGLLAAGAFAVLFWAGCSLVLVRMLRSGNTRLWLLYGLLAGLGLENRHAMALLVFGTVVALLLVPERRLLASRWFWLGMFLAFLIFLPNLVWQRAHELPLLDLLRIPPPAAGTLPSRLDFLVRQLFLLNPLALPIWLGGLAWCFTRAGKRYRALAWIYLFVLISLLAFRPRPADLLPAYAMLLGAGAVAAERWLEMRRAAWAWLRPGYVCALVLAGALLAPTRLPLLPLNTYIHYAESLHLAPSRPGAPDRARLPRFYASMFGWRDMVATIARIYYGLPPGMRAHTAIFCANYGAASAIDFFGPRYRLPRAICLHGAFYEWGPGKARTLSVLSIGVSRNDLQRTFSWVEPVTVLDNRRTSAWANGPIFYCRGPNVPFRSSWTKLKRWY
jgi:hypothetical protein